jgi:phosphatidylinositol glycan class S
LLLRTSILLTADDTAFPDPGPGRIKPEKAMMLEAIAKDVSTGVDGIYERARPKETRKWDLVWKADRRK